MPFMIKNIYIKKRLFMTATRRVSSIYISISLQIISYSDKFSKLFKLKLKLFFSKTLSKPSTLIFLYKEPKSPSITPTKWR